MNEVLSTEDNQFCKCCGKFKLCKVYVLQSGNAEWVCTECRNGKRK